MGARSTKKSKGGGKKAARKDRKPRPWERQASESLVAFERFVIFRDMPERSQADVARIVGVSPSAIDQTAQKFNWQARTAAWEEELDRRARNAELAEIEKMAKRQVQIATGLQEAGALELEALVKRIRYVDLHAKSQPPGSPPRQPLTSIKDIVRLVESGTKLERLNRGEPTEHTEHSMSWSDLVRKHKGE